MLMRHLGGVPLEALVALVSPGGPPGVGHWQGHGPALGEGGGLWCGFLWFAESLKVYDCSADRHFGVKYVPKNT